MDGHNDNRHEHTLKKRSSTPLIGLFFSHLLPGIDVRRGVDEVFAPDAAPAGAVVGDGHGGLDELIVHHVSFKGHDTAARQLADLPFGSGAHHLAVDGEVLIWDSN